MVQYIEGVLVGVAIASLFINRGGGHLCPRHHMPTYWDDDYGKERCSVTNQAVKNEGDK